MKHWIAQFLFNLLSDYLRRKYGIEPGRLLASYVPPWDMVELPLDHGDNPWPELSNSSLGQPRENARKAGNSNVTT